MKMWRRWEKKRHRWIRHRIGLSSVFSASWRNAQIGQKKWSLRFSYVHVLKELRKKKTLRKIQPTGSRLSQYHLNYFGMTILLRCAKAVFDDHILSKITTHNLWPFSCNFTIHVHFFWSHRGCSTIHNEISLSSFHELSRNDKTIVDVLLLSQHLTKKDAYFQENYSHVLREREREIENNNMWKWREERLPQNELNPWCLAFGKRPRTGGKERPSTERTMNQTELMTASSTDHWITTLACAVL